MMFRHQRIGSRQHGRDCRLLRASRVSVALLALAGALLICGLAGAAEYGEIDVTAANCAQWSTNLSNNESRVAGIIIENATVKSDAS